MVYLFWACLGLSLVANAILGYQLYKKKHVLTVDAKRLLAEFMSGGAVVDIRVLDASGIFYRSPRG